MNHILPPWYDVYVCIRVYVCVSVCAFLSVYACGCMCVYVCVRIVLCVWGGVWTFLASPFQVGVIEILLGRRDLVH